MADGNLPRTDMSNGHTVNMRHRTIIGYILIAAFGSLFLFLLTYYLQEQFPQVAGLWEGLKTLAIALFPAIVVAILDHFHTIRAVSDRMAMLVAKEVTDKLVAGRERYGLISFLDKMSFAALFRELEPGDELLWLSTYGPNYRDFLGEVEPAIINGAKLRMLIIDPDCENAYFRAEEIHQEHGYPPATFRQETASFTDSIVAAAQRASTNPLTRGSCEIRMYRDLPCVPMYIIVRDGRLFKGYSSLLLTKPAGTRFVHFEWTQRAGGILEEMKNYFEQKWNAQVQGTFSDGRPRGQIIYSSSPDTTEMLPSEIQEAHWSGPPV